jgi:hypothetical protein
MRQESESRLFDHLGTCGVSLISVDLNASGCFIIVDGSDLERLIAAARFHNVSIRVPYECGRPQRSRSQRVALPSLTKILQAFNQGNVRVMYLVADPVQGDVRAADQHGPSAMRILHEQ